MVLVLVMALVMASVLALVVMLAKLLWLWLVYGCGGENCCGRCWWRLWGGRSDVCVLALVQALWLVAGIFDGDRCCWWAFVGVVAVAVVRDFVAVAIFRLVGVAVGEGGYGSR